MKRSLLLILILVTLVIPAFAQQVGVDEARTAALHKMSRTGLAGTFNIREEVLFPDAGGQGLFYVFHLQPTGYVVVTARRELPPVIAYSDNGTFGPGNLLRDLITADLTLRITNQSVVSAERNRARWDSTAGEESLPALFQQWPEPGTTLTGGWLETNWTQNAPYNQLCPLDPVTGVRSIAGCPAVAMAQIVNFHQTVNQVYFDDNDDYYHSYAGRNYMIDDDYEPMDFPSFPALNGYLDTLEMAYDNGTTPQNRDMAALTFACGVAATQVYTSTAAGTFGVDQAYAAYQKFNFDEADLVFGTDTTLFARMSQNIKDTMPIHMAVLDPAGTIGHNLVADGYNTDEYYHLNFGWGGPYNGWYLLPDEIPYGLTVIDGVVLDIRPDDVTGVGQTPVAKVLFYPNPACGRIFLSREARGYSEAVIYSTDGKIRKVVQPGPGMTIDISDLPPGLYLVRLSGEKGVAVGKTVIVGQ